MFFEQYSHEPNIATPRFWTTHSAEITEERQAMPEAKRKLGYATLGVMETHLREYAYVADEGGFDLCGYPAVRAWLERVKGQPGHGPITRG